MTQYRFTFTKKINRNNIKYDKTKGKIIFYKEEEEQKQQKQKGELLSYLYRALISTYTRLGGEMSSC